MNLFVTDADPKVAVTHLDDVRLNKMITESCQVIVMALSICGLPDVCLPLTIKGKPYRVYTAHRKHPVTLWTACTRGNFEWHLRYLEAAMDEYHYRKHKTRAGMNIIDLARARISLIPEGDRKQFQNSSLYKDQSSSDIDVIASYRNTMLYKWKSDKIKLTWTVRGYPLWAAGVITSRSGHDLPMS